MSRSTLRLWSLVSLAVVTCGGGGGGGSGAISFAGLSATVTPAPAPAPAPASAPVPVPVPGAAAPPDFTPATGPLKVVELATDLVNPWSLAFLPDGRMLITQREGTVLREGQLRLRKADGSAEIGGNDLISGVPAVEVTGQGGLLDVVLDPAFSTNRRIYLSFSEQDSANSALNGTSVARAELDLANRRLDNLTVIYRQTPKVNSGGHFGSRLAFDRAGYLFVTMGERLNDDQRGFAQDLTRGHGKVVRITTDGAPAPGNPNFGVAGAQPHIWSYGHRTPQGAALHPSTGELWTHEHGPAGGDEVNRTLPGRNYGWPVISYGQEYGSNTQVGEGTAKAGMEQPVTYWETSDGSPWTGGGKSSIAPSGMAFYTSSRLDGWKGNLFAGALAGRALWRLTLNGNSVTARERLLADRQERIRDVRQGPDGWLYLLTDGNPGKLLRLERAPS